MIGCRSVFLRWGLGWEDEVQGFPGQEEIGLGWTWTGGLLGLGLDGPSCWASVKGFGLDFFYLFGLPDFWAWAGP